jgi:hypothetical protein
MPSRSRPSGCRSQRRHGVEEAVQKALGWLQGTQALADLLHMRKHAGELRLTACAISKAVEKSSTVEWEANWPADTARVQPVSTMATGE